MPSKPAAAFASSLGALLQRRPRSVSQAHPRAHGRRMGSLRGVVRHMAISLVLWLGASVVPYDALHAVHPYLALAAFFVANAVVMQLASYHYLAWIIVSLRLPHSMRSYQTHAAGLTANLLQSAVMLIAVASTGWPAPFLILVPLIVLPVGIALGAAVFLVPREIKRLSNASAASAAVSPRKRTLGDAWNTFQYCCISVAIYLAISLVYVLFLFGLSASSLGGVVLHMFVSLVIWSSSCFTPYTELYAIHPLLAIGIFLALHFILMQLASYHYVTWIVVVLKLPYSFSSWQLHAAALVYNCTQMVGIIIYTALYPWPMPFSPVICSLLWPVMLAVGSAIFLVPRDAWRLAGPSKKLPALVPTITAPPSRTLARRSVTASFQDSTTAVTRHDAYMAFAYASFSVTIYLACNGFYAGWLFLAKSSTAQLAMIIAFKGLLRVACVFRHTLLASTYVARGDPFALWRLRSNVLFDINLFTSIFFAVAIPSIASWWAWAAFLVLEHIWLLVDLSYCWYTGGKDGGRDFSHDLDTWLLRKIYGQDSIHVQSLAQQNRSAWSLGSRTTDYTNGSGSKGASRLGSRVVSMADSLAKGASVTVLPESTAAAEHHHPRPRASEELHDASAHLPPSKSPSSHALSQHPHAIAQQVTHLLSPKSRANSEENPILTTFVPSPLDVLHLAIEQYCLNVLLKFYGDLYFLLIIPPIMMIPTLRPWFPTVAAELGPGPDEPKPTGPFDVYAPIRLRAAIVFTAIRAVSTFINLACVGAWLWRKANISLRARARAFFSQPFAFLLIVGTIHTGPIFLASTTLGRKWETQATQAAARTVQSGVHRMLMANGDHRRGSVLGVLGHMAMSLGLWTAGSVVPYDHLLTFGYPVAATIFMIAHLIMMQLVSYHYSAWVIVALRLPYSIRSRQTHMAGLAYNLIQSACMLVVVLFGAWPLALSALIPTLQWPVGLAFGAAIFIVPQEVWQQLNSALPHSMSGQSTVTAPTFHRQLESLNRAFYTLSGRSRTIGRPPPPISVPSAISSAVSSVVHVSSATPFAPNSSTLSRPYALPSPSTLGRTSNTAATATLLRACEEAGGFGSNEPTTVSLPNPAELRAASVRDQSVTDSGSTAAPSSTESGAIPATAPGATASAVLSPSSSIVAPAPGPAAAVMLNRSVTMSRSEEGMRRRLRTPSDVYQVFLFMFISVGCYVLVNLFYGCFLIIKDPVGQLFLVSFFKILLRVIRTLRYRFMQKLYVARDDALMQWRLRSNCNFDIEVFGGVFIAIAMPSVTSWRACAAFIAFDNCLILLDLVYCIVTGGPRSGRHLSIDLEVWIAKLVYGHQVEVQRIEQGAGMSHFSFSGLPNTVHALGMDPPGGAVAAATLSRSSPGVVATATLSRSPSLPRAPTLARDGNGSFPAPPVMVLEKEPPSGPLAVPLVRIHEETTPSHHELSDISASSPPAPAILIVGQDDDGGNGDDDDGPTRSAAEPVPLRPKSATSLQPSGPSLLVPGSEAGGGRTASLMSQSSDQLSISGSHSDLGSGYSLSIGSTMSMDMGGSFLGLDSPTGEDESRSTSLAPGLSDSGGSPPRTAEKVKGGGYNEASSSQSSTPGILSPPSISSPPLSPELGTVRRTRVSIASRRGSIVEKLSSVTGGVGVPLSKTMRRTSRVTKRKFSPKPIDIFHLCIESYLLGILARLFGDCYFLAFVTPVASTPWLKHWYPTVAQSFEPSERDPNPLLSAITFTAVRIAAMLTNLILMWAFLKYQMNVSLIERARIYFRQPFAYLLVIGTFYTAPVFVSCSTLGRVYSGIPFVWDLVNGRPVWHPTPKPL
ncbi:hypothetical protein H9P43_008205 [Blastocladiella emersonii ATCC 22665]|nr:hypothetical protein H9P43_008205 [Blastocladiella emersonii ATCC 22665]